SLPQGCVAPKLAADVPLPPNITDQQFFSQGGVTVVNFKTTDDISVLAAFFTKNLPPLGWTAGRNSTSAQLITLNYSKGANLTFTAGLWNIGIEGQIVLGAIGATWAVRTFPGLPAPVLLPLVLLGAALFGAAWGWLVGALKVYGNVHEIFGGLGLNFVAMGLT